MNLKGKLESIARSLNRLSGNVDSLTDKEKEYLDNLLESNRCTLSLFFGQVSPDIMTRDFIAENIAQRILMNREIDSFLMGMGSDMEEAVKAKIAEWGTVAVVVKG